MTTIYLSNLDTTITATTAAEFAGTESGAPNVTFGDQYVDVSIPLADAKGLFQFSSDGTDVNEDDVTGAMTDKSGATVSSKPDSTSAVTIDYVKELTRLVFGTDLLVDALDNEDDIATDYVAKYDDCIAQVLAGGGAATDPVTDRTESAGHGPAAAVAAVAGLLNDSTSRQRFELQYNFAPLETFNAKDGCAVYLKDLSAGDTAFSSTALPNFDLNVTMTDENTLATITRGTITQDNSRATLGTGDTLLIQNQNTGETTTTVLTADTAALLNNTSENLTNILTKADFGFVAATGIPINTTIAGPGSGAKFTVTVTANNAIDTLRVDTAGQNYSIASEFSIQNNGKTITISNLTEDHVNTLNGSPTNPPTDFLAKSSAAFADVADVAFNGSNGTGTKLSLITDSGVPIGITIDATDTDGGYITGATNETASVSMDGKDVDITIDNPEVTAQLNGLSYLKNIFYKANFGYSAVTGGVVSVQSGTAADTTNNATAATLDIVVDARGAVTSIKVNGTNAGYDTDSVLQVTSGNKTIKFTVGTAAVLDELRGVTTNGDNLLEITDAAFTTTGAVAFDESNGTGAKLTLTAANGVPTALDISGENRSGYVTGATDETAEVSLNGKSVAITIDDPEVNAQLNGLTINSSIVASGTAVTAVKGSGFTAGVELPVTEVTGSAAGDGAGAKVTVEMNGATVSSVQKTSSYGSNYDETHKLIVTNFTDGTVISTGSNNANSVQVGILNGNMSGVNVPFEGSDKILTKVSIKTPDNQTNTADETPAAFTQTSVLRISFT